jgi:hypothetical protein
MPLQVTLDMRIILIGISLLFGLGCQSTTNSHFDRPSVRITSFKISTVAPQKRGEGVYSFHCVFEIENRYPSTVFVSDFDLSAFIAGSAFSERVGDSTRLWRVRPMDLEGVFLSSSNQGFRLLAKERRTIKTRVVSPWNHLELVNHPEGDRFPEKTLFLNELAWMLDHETMNWFIIEAVSEVRVLGELNSDDR